MNLCKNEQMDLLKQLLCMEDLIHKCKLFNVESKLGCKPGGDADHVLTDDKERYLKMAIRINPSDLFILCRKKNKNYLQRNCERQKS